VAVVSLLAGFYLLSNDPNGSKTSVSTGPVTVNMEQPGPFTDNPPVYTDDFDGANDTNALKARGYKPYYRGTGPQGLTATWFQGNSSVFPAFNGPPTGYVAANYNVVTGTNNIDSWLVFPRIVGGLLSGDSLYFRSRSPTGSIYPDSIRVMYSANDSVPEGTWTELGRFKVNTAGMWELRGFRAPTTSVNGRFAIRYAVVNGGPTGNNSDYIGIDAAVIIRTAQPPPVCSWANTLWCPQGTLPNIPAATLYNACAWIGDTMYMHAPDGTGAATTTIQRYALGGGWTAGVPLPVPKTQGTLTAAAGKLYYIGGSATVGGSGSTDVYEYNPSTGAWTLKAPIPSPTQGHGAAAWGDSVIFITMGPWGTPTTTCQFYRVSNNTSGLTTAFTGPARRSHAMGLWGNKIYIAGGFPFTNTFYIGTIGADASTITWTAGPPYPSVPKSRIGGVAYGDRFYIVGGNNSAGTISSDSTFVWNITAGVWTALQSVKPAAVHNIEAAVTARCVGDTVKIYCPGGSSQSATTLNFDVIGCGATILGIENQNTNPLAYSLSQNYPNPFNPVTVIAYSIPKGEDVKLIVYDLLGREVVVLVNEFKQAGKHAVEFNASAFASGVYFYRLEAGTFTDTKKMLLVK